MNGLETERDGSGGSDRLAFGLRWRSEIPLPELRAAPDVGAVDVDVRLGRVPPLAEPFTTLDGVAQVSPRAFVLEMTGVGRFGAYDGECVVIEPAEGVDPADVRAHLLGSVTGALLLQRDLLPLHASAVMVGDGAVAIAGPSGAGKSTLAAALEARGCPFLSDDICALDLSDPTQPRMWPGLARAKLWEGSLRALGRSGEGLDPVRGSDGKFSLRASRPAPYRATRLRAICFLERGESSVVLERLPGAAAFGAILSNTFRGLLVKPMGRGSAHFANCTALARACPVFRLSRPWNIGDLMSGAEMLLHRLAPGQDACLEPCAV